MKKILLTLLIASASFSTQAQIGPDPGFEGPEAYFTNYMCVYLQNGSSPVILYTGSGFINIADERANCESLGGNGFLYGPPPAPF